MTTDTQGLKLEIERLRALLREAVDIKNHHSITDLTDPVRMRIEAELAKQPQALAHHPFKEEVSA